jgi:DNA replication protein DnaC
VINETGVGMLCSLIDILGDMRASYDDDNANMTGFFSRSMNTPLLVLDDLGAEKVTDKNRLWVEEIFYKILDHRIRYCLPTVVTTNATMEDLNSRFGERIMSRLIGVSDVVMAEGPDYRNRQ